jgi:hypothetical protein
LRFMEESNWDFEQKSEPIIPKIERQCRFKVKLKDFLTDFNKN